MAARNPAHWIMKTIEKLSFGMNDTMNSAALMTMQTAGITTGPEDPVDPPVGDATADDGAGDATQDGQQAEDPVGRLGRGGAGSRRSSVARCHRGDDEADRRHPDQCEAEGRNPEDHPDVLAEPVDQVVQKVPQAVGERGGPSSSASSIWSLRGTWARSAEPRLGSGSRQHR